MSNKLRTIVVEDERLPRLTLLQKLRTALADEVEVVADCDNYETAKHCILEQKPDLLLMDIQLQGRDSITLLHELEQEMTLPAVIFTTAYDERSDLMSAIKLQAVDYLLKPIGIDELTAAVRKVQCRMAATKPELGMHFRTSTGSAWIASERIAYIKAARNYSVLVCFGSEEMLLDSLSVLESRLDSRQFLRIDRSTIINRRTLCEVNKRRGICRFEWQGKVIELKLTKVGMERLEE